MRKLIYSIILTFCIIETTACGKVTQVFDTVEDDEVKETPKYVVEDTVDNTLNIFNSGVCTISTICTTVPKYPDYCYLYKDSEDCNYLVYGKKPEDCDDITNYVLTDNVITLSSEDAEEVEYITSAPSDDISTTSTFYCEYLYNTDGDIVGVVFTYSKLKGSEK